MSDLDAVVRRLQDQQEILALKHRFLRAADELSTDGMMSVFTEDVHAYYGPGEDFHSAAELRGWYGQEQSITIVSNHQIHNFELVFLSDDEASSRCILHSWKRFIGYPERPDRNRFARYFDTWLRTPDGWRQSGLYYAVQGESNGSVPERTCEPEPSWPPAGGS